MPFVGLSVKALPEEDCVKKYEWVQTYQLAFGIQNAWKQPKAQAYVSNLIKEAPCAVMTGKLAVVTGVTIGGAGYHMAQELALQAKMHVVLLGRSKSKVKAAMEAMEQEAAKRALEKPTLFETAFDLDSLATAKTAAQYVTKLAKEKYDGKLHVLLNNAGVVVGKPCLTKDGIEANVGRNFITVHHLTEQLLPVLKAAATPDYKPRVVDISSIVHIFGADFLPKRLLEYPKLGGAPEGSIIEKDGSIAFATESMVETNFQYGRAKMGVVAITQHSQKMHPELNFVCLHPGSIISNFGSDLGIAAKIYYYGFWLFNFSASQGAVAALRACLDPDFNTEADLQGAYLHCDGNPWIPMAPTSINPDTNKAYTREEFAKATAEVADKLIEKCRG